MLAARGEFRVVLGGDDDLPGNLSYLRRPCFVTAGEGEQGTAQGGKRGLVDSGGERVQRGSRRPQQPPQV